eukprot:TRINITY_DN6015_c0_g1_i1.p2 TRINITY_DN6015_c0_g1~~TRINITY_DN6015_c0_g1_i1.p2  ORF type:complete len:125 (-),score=10.98 TRINITY_DN6015_c0_g1_i1:477-851(-)
MCVTKKSCPAKRQACGRTGQYIEAPYSPYHEFTADTFCCATGEECWFPQSSGTTECIKPVTCSDGIESCGHISSYRPVYDDRELYYGYIHWGHPDDVCCQAGEVCVDDGSAFNTVSYCDAGRRV